MVFFARRIRALAFILAGSLAVGPSLALAEEAKAVSEEKGPRSQDIESVERGFFLETDVGLGYMVTKLELPGGTKQGYGLLSIVGLYAGFDVLPMLSFSVGAAFMGVSARLADSTAFVPDRDLLYVVPGANVQFALLTTERNFLWVRGGAGFGIASPESVEIAGGTPVELGGKGPVFSGSVGFERYTKLRHFSIGAAAGAVLVTKPSVGIAISLMPMLKYTF